MKNILRTFLLFTLLLLSYPFASSLFLNPIHYEVGTLAEYWTNSSDFINITGYVNDLIVNNSKLELIDSYIQDFENNDTGWTKFAGATGRIDTPYMLGAYAFGFNNTNLARSYYNLSLNRSNIDLVRLVFYMMQNNTGGGSTNSVFGIAGDDANDSSNFGYGQNISSVMFESVFYRIRVAIGNGSTNTIIYQPYVMNHLYKLELILDLRINTTFYNVYDGETQTLLANMSKTGPFDIKRLFTETQTGVPNKDAFVDNITLFTYKEINVSESKIISKNLIVPVFATYISYYYSGIGNIAIATNFVNGYVNYTINLTDASTALYNFSIDAWAEVYSRTASARMKFSHIAPAKYNFKSTHYMFSDYSTTQTSTNSINLDIPAQYYSLYNYSYNYSDYYFNKCEGQQNNSVNYPMCEFYDAVLNISALNQTGGAINYKVNITYLGTGYSENQSTTTGLIQFNLSNNTNYSIVLDALGFAKYNTSYLVTNTYDKYVFNEVYTDNSVNITVMDEDTGLLINNNVTVLLQSTTLSNQYNLLITNGTYYIDNIIPDDYIATFSTIGYSVRAYQISIGNRSHQNLNAYLLSSNNSVLLSLIDINTGLSLSDCIVTMYKNINGTLTTVESRLSDITGKVEFSFNIYSFYRFTANCNGYAVKTFDLNPILFTSYDIYMTPSSTIPPYYNDVNIIINPNYYYQNMINNFSFAISSPLGRLTSYGYNISTPCLESFVYSSSNAYGDFYNQSINLTCSIGFVDTVHLYYYYILSNGVLVSNYVEYPIEHSIVGNYTMLDNNKNTYGLGFFERILIITGIAIIIGGVAMMIGGFTFGVILVIIIYTFFGFIKDFIPSYLTIGVILVGTLMLLAKIKGE